MWLSCCTAVSRCDCQYFDETFKLNVATESNRNQFFHSMKLTDLVLSKWGLYKLNERVNCDWQSNKFARECSEHYKQLPKQMHDATSEPNKLSKYNEQKNEKISVLILRLHILCLSLSAMSVLRSTSANTHTKKLKQVITRKWRAKHRDAKLFSMSLPYDPKGVHWGRGWNIVNTHVKFVQLFHRWYSIARCLVTMCRPLWDYGDQISKICSQNSWNDLSLSSFAFFATESSASGDCKL